MLHAKSSWIDIFPRNTSRVSQPRRTCFKDTLGIRRKEDRSPAPLCCNSWQALCLLEKILDLVLRQDGLLVGLVDPASELGDRLVVRNTGRAPAAPKDVPRIIIKTSMKFTKAIQSGTIEQSLPSHF